MRLYQYYGFVRRGFSYWWWSGEDTDIPSSLDHMFAAQHLNFKTFAGNAELEVNGWIQKSTKAQQKKCIKDFSDHAYLFGEIHS